MNDMLDKLYAAKAVVRAADEAREPLASCANGPTTRTRERRPFRAALHRRRGTGDRRRDQAGIAVGRADRARARSGRRSRAHYEAAGANAISVLTESRSLPRRPGLPRLCARSAAGCRSCARTSCARATRSRSRRRTAPMRAGDRRRASATRELARHDRRGRALRARRAGRSPRRGRAGAGDRRRRDAARDQQPRSAHLRDEPRRHGRTAAARPVVDRRRSPRAACARAPTCSRSMRPARAAS